ncbi:MAG: UDP-N-acetylmuramoyl-L-alanyl-D-glutamate--2,6-diaminopimelate ligase [Lewinellaceae bacterium]|nr:UDP-N-acetylmuramoyl-L-alanyl-D-glutamate--2,6-diaminopimelate ligase [Lewinellaceae bacterium]
MKRLSDILDRIPTLQLAGDADVSIRRIAFDSRTVEPGDVFVAVRGVQVDGHRFIPDVLKKGVAAIVAETAPEDMHPDLCWVQVADSAEALGQLAANFYGRPSEKLQVVAVTGTNGKTTTVTLLFDLVRELGYQAGLLSTVENRIGDRVLPSRLTTPDPVYIQERMAEMVDAGCTYVFMEASSHAIHQKRIAGLYFTGAVFTNITHDHLDYHGTFKNYIDAKKMLFDGLPAEAFALVNTDDPRGPVMLQNTAAKRYTYSLKKIADYKAKILDYNLLGLHLELDGADFYGRLIGAFNAYNYLAVYATARLLGLDKMEVLTVLSRLTPAPGRFETVVHANRNVVGIVDYAHTPDALEKVLQTIEKLRKGSGRVITVVGCGGDRDKAKRPVMAKVACQGSNQVILTSDNPRSEEPEQILAEMQEGVPAADRRKVLSILSRREAIRTACALAHDGDIVLAAGKGHEKYQEIKGVRHPFDDVAELRAALSEMVPTKN